MVPKQIFYKNCNLYKKNTQQPIKKKKAMIQYSFSKAFYILIRGMRAMCSTCMQLNLDMLSVQQLKV